MKKMKPMLAATATVAEIEAHLARGPLIATPKLDGIRCLVKDGKLLSRSLKPIPNRYINEQLTHWTLEGLDGELMVGPVCPEQFQVTTSGVMRESGEPDFAYCVFDICNEEWSTAPYSDRLTEIADKLEGHGVPRVSIVAHLEVSTLEHLLEFETRVLDLGFEGLILRHPDKFYKYGRSTVKEAGMLKLKRFEDSEAIVVGYEAEMENTNVKQTNELGRSKRSSAKAGMVAKDTLGNLFLEDPIKGWKFSVGSGFDDAEAARLWAMGEKLIGLRVKYRFFPIGVKDAPRFPTYVGIRDERDMS